jgi:hypothetical protein
MQLVGRCAGGKSETSSQEQYWGVHCRVLAIPADRPAGGDVFIPHVEADAVEGQPGIEPWLTPSGGLSSCLKCGEHRRAKHRLGNLPQRED